MIARGALVALVVLVAGAAGAKKPPRKPRSNTVELTWSMKVDGAQLVVEYALRNPGREPLYVADRLLTTAAGNTFQPLPDALVVMNGERAGQVRLARAAISADVPSMIVYEPMFARVEPGHELHGRARVPWPLVAWHNIARVEPLRDPRTATLEVEYFFGEPPSWRELPAQAGGTLRIPEGMTPSLAQGPEQPLPR